MDAHNNPLNITPLIACTVSPGAEQSLELLLERRANMEIRSVFDVDPLANAAAYGQREVLQKLIEAHASMARGDAGINPLHWVALISGDADTAQQLVEARC